MLIEEFISTARQRLTTIKANASLVDAAKLLSDTHISLLVVCSPEGSMVRGRYKDGHHSPGRSAAGEHSQRSCVGDHDARRGSNVIQAICCTMYGPA